MSGPSLSAATVAWAVIVDVAQESSWLIEKRPSKHVLNDPRHEVGDPGIHAGVARLGAPVPEGHEADLHPAATHAQQQGPAAVTLREEPRLRVVMQQYTLKNII